jgi:transcriptional regulator with XRE-family HTH domain
MSEELVNRIRHLREVEGLSDRQIASQLGISRKRLARLLKGGAPRRKRAPIIAPYVRLIEEWYRQYPSLKAVQVYARLQSYGYPGAYTTVKDYTRSLRRKKKRDLCITAIFSDHPSMTTAVPLPTKRPHQFPGDHLQRKLQEIFPDKS